MISDNKWYIFSQPWWMHLGVLIKQDRLDGVQRWGSLTFPHCGLRACCFGPPFSTLSHDPGRARGFPVTFRDGSHFTSRNRKVQFNGERSNASLFPKPRPFYNVGTWTEGGDSGLGFHAPCLTPITPRKNPHTVTPRWKRPVSRPPLCRFSLLHGGGLHQNAHALWIILSEESPVVIVMSRLLFYFPSSPTNLE